MERDTYHISEFKKVDADVRATVAQYRADRLRYHILSALKPSK